MFKCKSLRMCRYLYSLGFEKKSVYENGKEYWIFEESNRLNKALDFFFYMRRTGVENAEIRYKNSKEDVP